MDDAVLGGWLSTVGMFEYILGVSGSTETLYTDCVLDCFSHTWNELTPISPVTVSTAIDRPGLFTERSILPKIASAQALLIDNDD